MFYNVNNVRLTLHLLIALSTILVIQAESWMMQTVLSRQKSAEKPAYTTFTSYDVRYVKCSGTLVRT